MSVKQLIAELDKIRTGERGNCFSVTLESAKVLTDGKSPEQITDDNAIYSTETGFASLKNGEAISTKREPFLKHQKQEFFNRIANAEPGTVFMVETRDEDHYYNIVKMPNNKIYLLDSDAKIYKQLKHPDDLIIQDGTKVQEELEGPFDYFHSSKKASDCLQLFEVGKLNKKWMVEKAFFDKPAAAQPSQNQALEQPEKPGKKLTG